MYFSRIQLNPQRRKTREALANPQVMHAMVASSAPPGMQTSEDGRLLWRIDRDSHDIRLYIASPCVPGLEHIVEQAGWTASPGQTTDYTRFLDRLTRGQEYAFRATLNPVKRQRVANSRGKVLPFCRETEQIDWLRSRSASWGFELPDIPREFDPLSPGIPDDSASPAVKVIRADDRVFRKGSGTNRQHVTQRQVTFTGRLVVKDPLLMKRSLANGMGRGKAYGCGLMTLARSG